MNAPNPDPVISEAIRIALSERAAAERFASAEDYAQFLLIEQLQRQGVRGLERHRLALIQRGPLHSHDLSEEIANADENERFFYENREEIERRTLLSLESGPAILADDAYWEQLRRRVDERVRREKPAA